MSKNDNDIENDNDIDNGDDFEIPENMRCLMEAHAEANKKDSFLQRQSQVEWKHVLKAILIIILYIVVGGVTFSYWRGEMTILDAIYFTVVTFTTV